MRRLWIPAVVAALVTGVAGGAAGGAEGRELVGPNFPIGGHLAVYEKPNPDAAYNLVLDLIRRVAELTDEVRSLALDDVYARVRDLLHKTAVEQEDGTLVVEAMTQQDLANRIGASREMVSRIFKDLRAGGYLDVKGRRITINRHLPAQW